MSDLKAVQCSDCGGAIAFPETKSLPECPFCGSSKQIPKPLDRQVLPPQTWIAYSITQQEADEAFRVFAQSSFWYPKEVRTAQLELKQIFLPAWRWSGKIETHFNGLISAHSKSGYRPISGIENRYFDEVWVPSSKALSVTEVNQIAPFPKEESREIETLDTLIPYELGELTERIALKEAKNAMSILHRTYIQNQGNLRKLRTSDIFHDMNGEPGLVPVYIGVYRFKDQHYRILVNGSTGKMIGDAPLDWVKILSIVGGVLLLIAAIMMISGNL